MKLWVWLPVQLERIMTEVTTVSGMTQTAPAGASVEAQDPKIMLLAIHRGEDDQILITPIDVEHDTDDLSEMSEGEKKAKKILDRVYETKQADMKEALTALYRIYEHRLYRNQFRTFENFCFAIYGTNRIDDLLLKKARQRTKALEAELKEMHEQE
jgi:hypothetical protein